VYFFVIFTIKIRFFFNTVNCLVFLMEVDCVLCEVGYEFHTLLRQMSLFTASDVGGKMVGWTQITESGYFLFMLVLKITTELKIS